MSQIINATKLNFVSDDEIKHIHPHIVRVFKKIAHVTVQFKGNQNMNFNVSVHIVQYRSNILFTYISLLHFPQLIEGTI